MIDRWKNPYQRFGFVIANVLIGDHIQETDKHLFFGPIHKNDLFLQMPVDMTLPQLMRELGLFESSKDAKRNGYAGDIPEGFTDLMNIGRESNRVTILKITKPSEEDG